MKSAFRKELRPMLRMAAPLAIAELGWMSMAFVDILMAGRLGPAALGAGGVGSVLVFCIVVAGTGLTSGLDTLVSHAFGAGDDDDGRRSLIAGVWLALAITPIVTGLLLATMPLLRAVGTNTEVMRHLDPFVSALAWGIAPLMFYSVFRRYLQARNIVRPITFGVISANLVNFAGNWLLMYGNWGAPRMGLTGSGVSTSISRLYIAVVLLAAVVDHERKSGGRLWHMSWAIDTKRVRRLVELGIPAALQIGFEGALFAIVGVMAAKLDAISLAAHTVALNVISITYMVPLGVSAAAAVRVGQAVGRRDPHGASVSGWTALALGAAFMGSVGVLLFLCPRAVSRIYTPERDVIAASATLLWIAAFFELFDGLQVVATGALRGLGDTRTPAAAHFLGYWVLGLPTAWILCFHYNWGVRGIWVGLTVALVVIGLVLIAVWGKKVGAGVGRPEGLPHRR